jgi:uncharacterized membrane protein
VSDQNKPKASKHRASKIVIAVIGHFVATITLFVAFVALFTTDLTVGLMRNGLQETALRPEIVSALVLLFGVAGCTWALCFIAYSVFRHRLRSERKLNVHKTSDAQTED